MCLTEQYPPWLESNKAKLTDAEYRTYSTQCSYVSKIMTKFDDPIYNDEDKQAKTEVMDLMQKVPHPFVALSNPPQRATI